MKKYILAAVLVVAVIYFAPALLDRLLWIEGIVSLIVGFAASRLCLVYWLYCTEAAAATEWIGGQYEQ